MVATSRTRRIPVGQWVVRHRWWIAAVMSAVALLTEAIGICVASRGLMGTPAFTGYSIVEASLFAVVFPLVTGLCLSFLERVQIRSAYQQVSAAQGERQRISQELHDSLAQELSYLYLKLDGLSTVPGLAEAAEVQQQLATMRDIANGAYDQVRIALATLRTASDAGLEAQLANQARQVAARAGFEVGVVSEGAAQPLPEHVTRRLLYLFREALANVEKHARARRVDILLAWAPAALTITFADDGRGFVPGEASAGDHFGMSIMQEHARALHARLLIDSGPQAGTKLTVEVPLFPDL